MFRATRTATLLLALFAYGAACAVRCTPAMAEDVVEQLESNAFESRGHFRIGGHSVRGFAKRSPEASAGGFLVLGDDGGVVRAYLSRTTPRGRVLTLYDTTQARPTGTRVGVVVETGARWSYEHARADLEEAERALDSWQQALSTSADLYSPDPQAARQAWLEVVEALEIVRTEHPTHLPALRDLITAYVELLSYEHGTPVGSNVTRLLPAALDDYEQLVGSLSPEEQAHARSVRAHLAFEIGLLPVARRLCGDEDAPLQRMIDLLSPGGFLESASFRVPSAAGHYTVSAYMARGEPPDPEMLFGRAYYVPHAAGTARVHGRVWYVLRSQTLAGVERYYLYAVVDGEPRLQRLFGPTRPTEDTVRTEIAGRMAGALDVLARPPPSRSRGRAWIVLLAVGALAVLGAVVTMRRRRRSPSRPA